MVRGRTFWARRYCVSMVNLNQTTFRKYIKKRYTESNEELSNILGVDLSSYGYPMKNDKL